MLIETSAPHRAIGNLCPVRSGMRVRASGFGPRARTLAALLLAGTSSPALAAPTVAAPISGTDAVDLQRPSEQPSDDLQTIIVTGDRNILADVPPERSLDEDSVAGYGLSTIEDLLGAIGAEIGDDEEPVILVNGERVENIDEIAGYPTEAVRELRILPRGSGAPVGGSARQRVYSLTLRNRLRTLALTAGWRIATERDWNSRRAEANFTSIKGPDRFNLTFRVRDEDDLLESDRGIIQPALATPYDLLGNVIPDPRGGAGEIDPLLSALLGLPVAEAAIPSAGPISLAAFAAGANQANVTDLGRFRTLRSSNLGYDFNGSMTKRLAPWLRSSLSSRLNWSDSRSLLGLPSATFILSTGSPFSPFSRDVGLAIYGSEPLGQDFGSFTGGANGNLNATIGRWLVSLIGSYSHSERQTRTERQDPAQASQPILIDLARNPFAGDLGDLLLIYPELSDSSSDSGSIQLRAVGSPFTLPAGRLRVTASGGFSFTRISANSIGPVTSIERRYSRDQFTLLASTEIPLASRRTGFLSALGDLSANLEVGLVDFSDIGSFTRHSLALTWSPVESLRIAASTSSIPRAVDVRIIADPVLTTPGARYLDFLTGETVDVTEISGGNPFLKPERLEVDRVTITASPLQSINLQLNAEYSRTRTQDFISGVPPASAAIQLAFPDRFVRDANGRLVSVDVTPINFQRQQQEQLRYGFSFNLPIGPAPARRPAPGAADEASAGGEDEDGAPAPVVAAGPRPLLQVSASHAILLANEVLVRPGLAPIDLLAGGAIGISGGPPRHLLNFSATASGRGLGASITGSWRSESRVLIFTPGSVGELRFSPIATLNLRAFAEGRRLFPQSEFMRNARLTLILDNIANERQTVRDELGATPLRYQAAYRDPVGRTIGIELRKVF